MPIEITLSIIFLSLILLLFILSYLVSKKSNPISSELLSKTRLEATEIMTQAELASIEMSVQERILLKESLKSFEFQLNSLKTEISEGLKKEGERGKEALVKQGRQLDTQSQEMVKEFQKNLTQSLETYELKLKESVDGFQNSLMKLQQNQISETLATTTEEIEKYKKDQIELVNENILKILEKTVLEASSQIISVDQHREIIFACFEKAKNEGLFKKDE